MVFTGRQFFGFLLVWVFCVSAKAQNKPVSFDVNGLKVILFQTQKETVAMNMYFRGGVMNYPAEKAGIESLALDAAIECGTERLSADAYHDKVDEFGLHIESQASADYGVIKMRCISRFVNEGWEVFAGAIASPVFDAGKFELLRSRQIEEFKSSQANPDSRLRNMIKEFVFTGTPYAVNPSGTEQSLKTLRLETVKDYYLNTLLSKKRIYLVVAGNISREALTKKIEESFSRIPEGEYKPSKTAVVEIQKDKYKIESRNIAANYLAGVIPAPAPNHPDYPAFRVAVTILNSSVFNQIRVAKHLSYAPSATLTEGKNSYLVLYASTAKPYATVSAMQSIVSSVRSNYYTDNSITEIVKGYRLNRLRSRESMSEMAATLGDDESLESWQLDEALEEKFSQVKPNDVREMFRKYSKHIAWVYLGDNLKGQEAFTEQPNW